MLTVKPFKAIRPRTEPDDAGKIAALPYDVMNTEEAREMVKDKPLSFLHVDKAEIDLPPGTDPHSDEVYALAKKNLEYLINEGHLIQDEKPCFYIYKLNTPTYFQAGLVACPSVDDYIEGRIKKHELTRADKEEDRIRHVDTLNANTGPIFLMHKPHKELREIIYDITFHQKKTYIFLSDEQVLNEVWVVDDPDKIKEIQEIVNSMDALYIADGHHRCASAVKVAQMRRNQFPHYSGDEEFNSFLAVMFPSDQLSIKDYNRVVKDLNGHSTEEFLKLVAEKFDVEKKDAQVKPKDLHTFGMYLDGSWYKLTAHEDTYPKIGDYKEAVVDALDVAILQRELLSPILGIEDPRTDPRIDFVGGIRGIGELERRASSDMKVAFSMYRTSLDELMAVADAGLIMPPKSTWFEPKLLSGLFIHSLE